MPLSPGTKLGPYEILAPLGAGGMGEVYRSRDGRLGRDVALKVIPHDASQDSERIRRFEQEARAAGTLSHPNVCAVYDVGRHGGSPFVVMELLEGETLRGVLESGALPLRKAIAYAAQAAEGLATAHAKGIVHRDLKPENLFVTKDGHVKVLDFGLAKLAAAESASGANDVGGSSPTIVTPPHGTVTTPGTLLGTASYMAPEQLRGDEVDARADVFALGIVLFETLTGRRPFEGRTPADVMSAILHQPAPGLDSWRPESPPALVWLVRRCLAKEPARRIQTILDVRNELEEILDDLEHGAAEKGVAARAASEPVERQLPLTAAHVRTLSAKNPRLIGYPLTYLDNRRESETLVVFLHGVGGDYRRFERSVRGLPYRCAAVALAGFAPSDPFRPTLSFEDHSQLVRIFLGEIVRECRPSRVVLVGFSAGADQFLRMLDSPEGLGVEVGGLVMLGTNVSLETCFVSSRYATMDLANPAGTLSTLQTLSASATTLSGWLALMGYMAQTINKFGPDLEALRRYSADIVAPFENGGDPLPAWYRAATERVPCVRFVFSNTEAAPAENVLARHLEQNILGDRFTERSWVTQRVSHGELPEPHVAHPHIESVVAELTSGRG